MRAKHETQQGYYTTIATKISKTAKQKLITIADGFNMNNQSGTAGPDGMPGQMGGQQPGQSFGGMGGGFGGQTGGPGMGGSMPGRP